MVIFKVVFKKDYYFYNFYEIIFSLDLYFE